MTVLIILAIIGIICIGFYIVFKSKFDELQNEIRNISVSSRSKSNTQGSESENESEDYLNYNTMIKETKQAENKMMDDYMKWLKMQDESKLDYIHLKRKRDLERKGHDMTNYQNEIHEMSVKKNLDHLKSGQESFGKFWRDCDWCA